MQLIMQYGIAFIVGLQSMEMDWLTSLMRFFSALGNEEFFMLLLPLLYWSIDSALGLRVGLILLTSNLFNHAGKLLLAGPRPYWVSPEVHTLWSSETSFGAPSGHAQLAVSVWGMMAAYVKRPWGWIAAVMVMFLIGFSRMYLGVHFPHDVLLGWLLGAIILWIFIRFWEPASRWVKNKSLPGQVATGLIISLIFILIGHGTWLFTHGFSIPSSWIENSLAAGAEKPEPLSADATFTSAGTFFGLAVGSAWIYSSGRYKVRSGKGSLSNDPLEKRALRYIIGVAGLLILYAGLGAIFPRGNELIHFLLRYIRYGLVGWWVAGGAPWVFIKFKLTENTGIGSTVHSWGEADIPGS